MRTLWIAALLAIAGPAAAVVGGGDVTFQVKGASQAVFSYDKHVVDAKLGCRDCHPKLYLDTARHSGYLASDDEELHVIDRCRRGLGGCLFRQRHAASPHRGGSGLVTLEKRVEMLGGNINYQSATGRGTRVRVLIPS